MFNQISTSKENKEIVTLLTRKLNLGTENIIARIASVSYTHLDVYKRQLLHREQYSERPIPYQLLPLQQEPLLINVR